MKMPKTVEAALEGKWKTELSTLRNILLEFPLDEALKWGTPHYMLDGKIVVGITGFKEHFALWFHQGVFLKDPLGVLVNAGEGKTKGLRQWRFAHKADIDKLAVRQYVEEAIENQRKGLEIKPEPKRVPMPKELKSALEEIPELSAKFKALTPGKRKEYAEHIGLAKQAATRERRLKKAIPLILAEKGLNDRYR